MKSAIYSTFVQYLLCNKFLNELNIQISINKIKKKKYIYFLNTFKPNGLRK